MRGGGDGARARRFVQIMRRHLALALVVVVGLRGGAHLRRLGVRVQIRVDLRRREKGRLLRGGREEGGRVAGARGRGDRWEAVAAISAGRRRGGESGVAGAGGDAREGVAEVRRGGARLLEAEGVLSSLAHGVEPRLLGTDIGDDLLQLQVGNILVEGKVGIVLAKKAAVELLLDDELAAGLELIHGFFQILLIIFFSLFSLSLVVDTVVFASIYSAVSRLGCLSRF